MRKLSLEARQLADMHFFETLVRLHRAGEGAGFTGLKPAGRDLGPAIPAADKALRDANVEPLDQSNDDDNTGSDPRSLQRDVHKTKVFEGRSGGGAFVR